MEPPPLPPKKIIWIQSKRKTSQNPQSCGSVICSAALFIFFCCTEFSCQFLSHCIKNTISALWWCVWRFERERYINDVFKKCLKSGRSLLFNLLFQKPLFFSFFLFLHVASKTHANTTRHRHELRRLTPLKIKMNHFLYYISLAEQFFPIIFLILLLFFPAPLRWLWGEGGIWDVSASGTWLWLNEDL